MANPLVTVQCVTCKEICQKADCSLWVRGEMTYGRCKPCASVTSRFNYQMKNLDDTASEFMSSMGAEAKREFLSQNKTLFGEALKVSMVSWAERTQEKALTDTYTQKGDWLDSNEVDARFIKSPAQAAAVKKNARSHFCPVREVDLYEVLEYTSKKKQKTEDRNFRTMTGESREQHRPAAKAKSAAGPSSESKFAKLVSRLKEKVEEHATQLELALLPSAQEWVPTKIVAQDKKLAASAKAEVAACEMAMLPEYEGNTDEIHKTAGETIVLLTIATKRLTKCLAIIEDEEDEVADTPGTASDSALPPA
jgi:hypothetical protein